MRLYYACGSYSHQIEADEKYIQQAKEFLTGDRFQKYQQKEVDQVSDWLKNAIKAKENEATIKAVKEEREAAQKEKDIAYEKSRTTVTVVTVVLVIISAIVGFIGGDLITAIIFGIAGAIVFGSASYFILWIMKINHERNRRY